MSFKKVKEGSIVKLAGTRSFATISDRNPLWGSNHYGAPRRTYGVVVTSSRSVASEGSFRVNWENNTTNTYFKEDLVDISDRKKFMDNINAPGLDYLQLKEISGAQILPYNPPREDFDEFVRLYGYFNPITDFDGFIKDCIDRPCWLDWLISYGFIGKPVRMSASENDFYDIGDRVRHPKSGRVYIITAISDSGEAVTLVNPVTGNRLRDDLFYPSTGEVHAIPKKELHDFLGYELEFVFRTI